ncbi:MAG: HypC/HybG/HupF family hydrogenase formation chaperone, partial [Thermomicrobium sp.]
MCLAIPGQIVALEPEAHLALVDVLGVRRRV